MHPQVQDCLSVTPEQSPYQHHLEGPAAFSGLKPGQVDTRGGRVVPIVPSVPGAGKDSGAGMDVDHLLNKPSGKIVHVKPDPGRACDGVLH